MKTNVKGDLIKNFTFDVKIIYNPETLRERRGKFGLYIDTSVKNE